MVYKVTTDIITNASASNNLIDKDDIIEAVQNEVQPGLIQQYIEGLPNKLLALGVKVLITFIVVLIGIKVIKLVRKIVKKGLEKAGVEKGVVQFTEGLVNAVLWIFLILWVALKFGVEATSIAALISSVSIAIGLALQGSLSNFAGGILILLLKPFRVGDYIHEDTHGNEGNVTEISLFYTRLLSPDGRTIILPNGSLSNNSLINFNHVGRRRVDLEVVVSYDSNIEDTRTVIMKLMDNNEDILQDSDKVVFVSELGESGIYIGVRCYTEPENFFKVKWQLLEDIKIELDKAGIEIPYPHIIINEKKFN